MTGERVLCRILATAIPLGQEALHGKNDRARPLRCHGQKTTSGGLVRAVTRPLMPPVALAVRLQRRLLR